VDAGHGLDPCPALYNVPVAVVKLDRPLDPTTGVVTVAGHVNEAGDLWARDVALPPVREGERLAFLPAGAYAAAMASDHCLRGRFEEIAVETAP
jgi:diaminopimelate decarboxylase